MARRRHERIRISLPVRVYGTDIHGKPFNVACESVDLSLGGARLTRPPFELRAGDVIGLQHKNDRARFQVKWLSDNEIGVALLEPHKNIWAMQLPAECHDTYSAIDHSSVEVERLIEHSAGSLPMKAEVGSEAFSTLPGDHANPINRLEWSVAQLKQAVNEVSKLGAHPQILVSLASAVESLRAVAFWTRHHLATKDTDPAALQIAPILARARAKSVVRDLRTLRMDLQSRAFSIDSDEVPELSAALNELSGCLGTMLHRPIPPHEHVRPHSIV